MSRVHIRDAQASDGARLADIYNPFIAKSVATFEEVAISAENMAERISKAQAAGYPYLVAERDDAVIGYAYAGQWKARAAYRHTAEVSIYVDPAARLKSLSIHTVMGVITLPNPASVKLHENFGLKKVAHFSEVGRKFDRWIDVGYWQGFLDPS